MLLHTPPPSLSEAIALFLDFDGTLTALQSDPDAVHISDLQTDALASLSERLGNAVAVVSGRDIRDLSKRVPTSLWRAGNHGLYVCPPEVMPQDTLTPAPDSLVQSLTKVQDSFPGTRLELKGQVLALHYRATPESETDVKAAAQAVMDEHDEYKLQSGKFVLEAKPVAANKGHAVAELMKLPPFEGRTPVMVGDDTTDEDAMEAVIASGGWAVKVGTGDSLAQYRLADPAAVWNWLGEG